MPPRFWVSLLVIATGLGMLCADPPLPPVPWTLNQPNVVPPTGPVPPPLLYVRLEGPKGSHATFIRGNQPQTIALPAIVGLRPGYIYRCALAGLPDRPGVVYFPTIEVRGSMILHHKLRGADFPATLVFRDFELEKASQGSLLRKIVVLERPDVAVPFASTPDSPIELSLRNEVDAFVEARERGMAMAVVYIGPRQYSTEELSAVPGTVFLPGDKTIGYPAAPPMVPWNCCSLVDPILKTVHPSEYTTVYDGGDSGLPAGHDKQGKLRGVDPSDTIAEYVDSRGRKKIAVSNCVALCLPRFILLKTETLPYVRASIANPITAVALASDRTSTSYTKIGERTGAFQVEIARERMKPSVNVNEYGVSVAGTAAGVKMKGTISAPRGIDSVKVMEKSLEDIPLLICKWPDRTGALIGEIITFYLKYSNPGKTPISDVVVIDNLTARFEYVKGTSKTDRDGTFTFQPNDVGSSLLRWEFNGPLLPGESGMISFQVRIR